MTFKNFNGFYNRPVWKNGQNEHDVTILGFDIQLDGVNLRNSRGKQIDCHSSKTLLEKMKAGSQPTTSQTLM